MILSLTFEFADEIIRTAVTSLRGRRKKGRGRGRAREKSTKEGKGKGVPPLSPQSPSLFPFLPIIYLLPLSTPATQASCNLRRIIQLKATEQYFPVVLFIMLCKVVLTFASMDEILRCDHSSESYRGVVSCGTVNYFAQGGSNYFPVVLFIAPYKPRVFFFNLWMKPCG